MPCRRWLARTPKAMTLASRRFSPIHGMGGQSVSGPISWSTKRRKPTTSKLRCATKICELECHAAVKVNQSSWLSWATTVSNSNQRACWDSHSSIVISVGLLNIFLESFHSRRSACAGQHDHDPGVRQGRGLKHIFVAICGFFEIIYIHRNFGKVCFLLGVPTFHNISKHIYKVFWSVTDRVLFKRIYSDFNIVLVNQLY